MPSQPPDCFLRFGLESLEDPYQAAQQLANTFAPIAPKAIILFAGDHLELLSRHVQERFPEAKTIGCSTAGEIGEKRFTTNSVSAVAFGEPARVAAQRIANLTDFRFEQGAPILERLCSDLGVSLDDLVNEPRRFLIILLADGLSGMEEVLLASLMVHVPNVKLVGGRAGDNFAFENTQIACSGKVYSHGAAILLLEPGVEFHTFAGHCYEPTDRTIVVTGADPERRLIHRIDGKPAAHFAAEYYGVSVSELERDKGALALSKPLVLGTPSGDEGRHFNRTLMCPKGTSLLMGGGIEEGSILTLMCATDIIEHAQMGMGKVRELCSSPRGQILFDCGGRLSQARANNQAEQLAQLVASVPTAGFTTYGEFFGPVLVNHTLSGVIFGQDK